MIKQTFRVQTRLYLTEDRKKVVPAGDSAGRYLFAKVGDEITLDLAERYGLIEKKIANSPPNKMADTTDLKIRERQQKKRTKKSESDKSKPGEEEGNG